MVTYYITGFIITIILVTLDMLRRDSLDFLTAWCIAIIWPISIASVLFLRLFDYLKVLELQGGVQYWYDKHIQKCSKKNRRKTDGDPR